VFFCNFKKSIFFSSLGWSLLNRTITMSELINGVLRMETGDVSASSDVVYMSVLFKNKKRSPDAFKTPLPNAVPVEDAHDLSDKTGMLYIKTKDKETFLSFNTWYKSIANSKISTLNERVDMIQKHMGKHGDFTIYYKPTEAAETEVTRIYYDNEAGKCDAKLPAGEWEHEYVMCCGGEKLPQGMPTNLAVFTRKH
jgi:hypothetical protein